jgi:peptidoglycan/xylan/chitin deacetylase (PgdA/CDA1 family)
LTVTIFHRVQPTADPLFPEELDAARFAALVERFQQWFTILPLSEAVERLAAGSLPPRALSITFDDGYADNRTVALPILQRLGVKATFFVAAGFLDGGRMFNDTVIGAVRGCPGPTLDVASIGLGVHDVASVPARRRAIETLIGALKHLDPREREERARAVADAAGARLPDDLMLSSQQVRELRAAGMEIGGHTLTHPILLRVSDAEARAEIATGHERLEAILGERVSLFAYPNGKPGRDYGPAHVRMVRELGFKAAFSTAHGAARPGDDLYQLPRFTPWAEAPWRQLAQFVGNLRRRDFAGAAP